MIFHLTNNPETIEERITKEHKWETLKVQRLNIILTLSKLILTTRAASWASAPAPWRRRCWVCARVARRPVPPRRQRRRPVLVAAPPPASTAPPRPRAPRNLPSRRTGEGNGKLLLKSYGLTIGKVLSNLPSLWGLWHDCTVCEIFC